MAGFRPRLVVLLSLIVLLAITGTSLASQIEAWVLVGRDYTTSTTGPFESAKPDRIGNAFVPRGSVSEYADIGELRLEYFSRGPARIPDRAAKNMHAVYSWTVPPLVIYPYERSVMAINADVIEHSTGDYAGGLSAGVTFRIIGRNGENAEVLAKDNKSYNLMTFNSGQSVEGRHYYFLDDMEGQFVFSFFGENTRDQAAIEIVFNTAGFHYRERYIYEWLPITETQAELREGARHQRPTVEQAPTTARYAWTEKTSYSPNEPIKVMFNNFPGNSQDWITIVQQNTPDDHYRQFFYTQGMRQGELDFQGLPAGDYEVRSYFNWPSGGYTVEERVAFTVGYEEAKDQLLWPARTFRAGEEIVVNYQGFSGSATDWVTIARANSGSNEWVHYLYTQGGTEGQLVFPSLEPGEYELRAYFDWPRGSFDIVSDYPIIIAP